MINDFLIPVSDSIKEFSSNLDDLFAIAKKVKFEIDLNSDSEKIILIGLSSTKEAKDALNNFRKEFYKLKFGDWHTEIIDFGNLLQGNTNEDSIFALKEIFNQFIANQNSRIVLIGDEAKQICWQHLALDKVNALKITNIDSRIAIGNIALPLSNENYFGKIIESKLQIYDYNHLGYQSYFVSPKELELLNQLNFDYYRLGEVYEKMEYFSPTLKNSNSVSINLNAISDFRTNNSESNPNGFSNREMCNLSYYSGLSTSLHFFGLFNCSFKKETNNQLISQLIWYFIEGNNNKQLLSYKENSNVEKYILPFQDKKLVFYKDKISNTWWLNKLENSELIICSKDDYEMAVDNNITKRIIAYLKKI